MDHHCCWKSPEKESVHYPLPAAQIRQDAVKYFRRLTVQHPASTLLSLLPYSATSQSFQPVWQTPSVMQVQIRAGPAKSDHSVKVRTFAGNTYLLPEIYFHFEHHQTG